MGKDTKSLSLHFIRSSSCMSTHQLPSGTSLSIVNEFAQAPAAFDTTDFDVEAIDLLANRITCDAGIAVLVAIISALKKTPVQPAMVVLGDLSI